ncbi:hypothetical protein Holit_02302 [Hollandina sp. SP2]
MALMIGIKIANGDFYPILGEKGAVKKRPFLTTAHHNQEILRIELYKRATKTLADACYMGGIAVKPLKPAPRGELSIKLQVALNPEDTQERSTGKQEFTRTPPQAASVPETAAPVIKAPVRALPPNQNRLAPLAASYLVPAGIPWGGALWDISDAFYRNPWLYPRIARFNTTRRPDLMAAGRTIRIPPRN